MNFTSNVAFAGLTAAGKTTHAMRLAAELGYDYISATELLMEILGIDTPGSDVWFTRLEEIQAARGDGAVDAELEERLVSMNRARERTVFDTWALAWIGDDPLLRIWLESDVESRARKCYVSQHRRHLSHQDCMSLIQEKDRFNRAMFHRRHGFDLFTDRHRYDIVLCNSHLIPTATEVAASSGIEKFAPLVHTAAVCAMSADGMGARVLRRSNPREVRHITVRADPSSSV